MFSPPEGASLSEDVTSEQIAYLDRYVLNSGGGNAFVIARKGEIVYTVLAFRAMGRGSLIPFIFQSVSPKRPFRDQ